MATTATIEDRTTDAAAKGFTAAVAVYILAALIALGARALNIPAPEEAITTLLIVATITASVAVTAMWAGIIIGSINTYRAKGQD